MRLYTPRNSFSSFQRKNKPFHFYYQHKFEALVEQSHSAACDTSTPNNIAKLPLKRLPHSSEDVDKKRWWKAGSFYSDEVLTDSAYFPTGRSHVLSCWKRFFSFLEKAENEEALYLHGVISLMDFFYRLFQKKSQRDIWTMQFI